MYKKKIVTSCFVATTSTKKLSTCVSFLCGNACTGLHVITAKKKTVHGVTIFFVTRIYCEKQKPHALQHTLIIPHTPRPFPILTAPLHIRPTLPPTTATPCPPSPLLTRPQPPVIRYLFVHERHLRCDGTLPVRMEGPNPQLPHFGFVLRLKNAAVNVQLQTELCHVVVRNVFYGPKGVRVIGVDLQEAEVHGAVVQWGCESWPLSKEPSLRCCARTITLTRKGPRAERKAGQVQSMGGGGGGGGGRRGRAEGVGGAGEAVGAVLLGYRMHCIDPADEDRGCLKAEGLGPVLEAWTEAEPTLATSCGGSSAYLNTSRRPGGWGGVGGAGGAGGAGRLGRGGWGGAVGAGRLGRGGWGGWGGVGGAGLSSLAGGAGGAGGWGGALGAGRLGRLGRAGQARRSGRVGLLGWGAGRGRGGLASGAVGGWRGRGGWGTRGTRGGTGGRGGPGREARLGRVGMVGWGGARPQPRKRARKVMCRPAES